VAQFAAPSPMRVAHATHILWHRLIAGSFWKRPRDFEAARRSVHDARRYGESLLGAFQTQLGSGPVGDVGESFITDIAALQSRWRVLTHFGPPPLP
jgi:hypothetical protein